MGLGMRVYCSSGGTMGLGFCGFGFTVPLRALWEPDQEILGLY